MKISRRVLSILTTAVLLISTVSFTALAKERLISDLSSGSTAVQESSLMNSAAKPEYGLWYVWVEITDLSDSLHDSCNNQAGYIELVTANDHWYSKMDEGVMDKQNATWTFANVNKMCQTSLANATADIKNNNRPIYGFPKEIRFVTENDKESTSYMKSLNKTWYSSWKISIYCTGDLDVAPKLVQEWEETTSPGGYWSDLKEVAKDNMSKPWHIANLWGPDVVDVPELGASPTIAYYYYDLYDQYGSMRSSSVYCENIKCWTETNSIGYYGCSLESIPCPTIIRPYCARYTVNDECVKYANMGSTGEGGDREATIQLRSPDGTVLTKKITKRWPKRTVKFMNADGTIYKGPMEVDLMSYPEYPSEYPVKNPDMYHHYDFVPYYQNPIRQSWIARPDLPEEGFYLYDTVFTPVFDTSDHYYRLDDAGKNHVCSKCGYVLSLADKLEGSGTESDPWKISGLDDWTFLHDYISLCKGLPPDNYFVLTDDINGVKKENALGVLYTSPFNGTFDGQGHTITVSDNGSDYFAPFLYIKNAAIKNVKTAGTVSSTNCSGLVESAEGTNLIKNCVVDVDITGNYCAGIVRYCGDISYGSSSPRSSTTIEECVFTGKLIYKGSSGYVSTFVGKNESKHDVTIADCLDLSDTVYPFARGDSNASQILTNSYYTFPGKNNSSMNCTPWRDSGKLACDLTCSGNIDLTLTGDVGIQYMGRIYVGEGEAFTFKAMKDSNSLSELLFIASDGTRMNLSSDPNGIFTLTAKDGMIGPYDYQLSLSGQGTYELPYLIKSTDDWNELAFYLACGGDTKDISFKLMNDIAVTTPIGSNNPFLGSFEGNGHEITIVLNGTDDAAPFSKVGDSSSSAVIKDLKVTGTIISSGKGSGGLVGTADGSLSVSNCVSDVVISTSYKGAGSHGGFIGRASDQSAVSIEGSVFTGKILTAGDTTRSAGFVGSGTSNTVICNCLYNPADLSEGESECSQSVTFTGGAGNVDNCYYIRPLGDAQGKAVLTVTEGDEYVEISKLGISGDPVANYNVSGITSYDQGISYRGIPLYGKGDAVRFELGHKDRDGYSFIDYYADPGTMTENDSAYEIILQDSDIKVYCNYVLPTVLNDPEIEIEDQEFIYNGQEFTPSVLIVKAGTTTLAASEYEVSYSNNINAGTATVIIKDKPGGFYTVNGSKTFVIEPKEITLSWSDTVFDYDGSSHCPAAMAQGLIGDDKCDVTVDGGMTKPGNHKATATGLSNSNYKLPQNNSIGFTINEAKPTPTVTPKVTVAPKPTGAAKPTTPAKPTNAAEPTTAAKGEAPKLDKTSASLVCGKNMTLKASAKGSAKISWKTSDTKIATVDKNGKVQAKMAGTVTITATASGKSAKCALTVLYKDVTNAKDFWYAPTNYLTAKGVVKGYADQTEFRPANVCTRAQMVTFIWRLQGEPKPKSATCRFSDVKKTDYFYKACIWGNENHIVEGYKDGTFGPQIVCARKHAVTFLWRLADKPAPKTKTNKFKDVKKSDYYYQATLWASEKNILAGYDDGTFRPNGDCLRRQMVTFLYKYDKFINGKG